LHDDRRRGEAGVGNHHHARGGRGKVCRWRYSCAHYRTMKPSPMPG
jgi:hypothetical protein